MKVFSVTDYQRHCAKVRRFLVGFYRGSEKKGIHFAFEKPEMRFGFESLFRELVDGVVARRWQCRPLDTRTEIKLLQYQLKRLREIQAMEEHLRK